MLGMVTNFLCRAIFIRVINAALWTAGSDCSKWDISSCPKPCSAADAKRSLRAMLTLCNSTGMLHLCLTKQKRDHICDHFSLFENNGCVASNATVIQMTLDISIFLKAGRLFFLTGIPSFFISFLCLFLVIFGICVHYSESSMMLLRRGRMSVIK